MIKKIISLVVALAIVACCVVSVSAADPDVTIVGLAGKAEVVDGWYEAEATESSLAVEPGDIVRVEWIWTLSEAMEAVDERIGAFNCFVAYDANAFELSSQDYEDPDVEWSMGDAFLDFASDRKMKYTGSTMLWNVATNPIQGGFTNANGVGYKANDRMWLSAQFKVKDTAASGTYPISLTINPLSNAGVDDAMRNLTADITNCELVVTGSAPLPNPADDVIAAIEALPSVDAVTLENKEAVLAARAAYEALGDNKGAVDNYDKLVALEEKIAELEAAAEKEAADKAAAKAVDDAIDAIDDPVTLESEEEIVAARQAYENLTDDQKGYVEKLADLQAAEADLAAAKDDKAVADVQDLIDALPESDDVTPADAEQIAAARAAYEALADDLKDRVDDDKLVADEKALEDYAANQVVAAIAALPGADEATLDDQDAVAAARNAYDALSEEDREKVNNYDKLVAVEAKLDVLAAVAAVEEMIAALPDAELVVPADAEAIEAARAAYDELGSNQDLVSNVDKLEAAETALADYAANQVIIAIAALPEANEVKGSDRTAITSARNAYDALSEEDRAKVGNYDKLVSCEEALALLSKDVYFTGNTVTIDPGEEAVVNWVVSFTDAAATKNIAAMNVTFDYDTDAFELVSQDEYEPDDATYALQFNPEISAGQMVVFNPDTSKLAMSCISGIGAARYGDKWWVSLKLRAKDGAAYGDHSIGFTVTALSTSNFARPTFESTAATITINDYSDVDAVVSLIDALPEINELTLSDKEAVDEARTAYEALAQDRQAKVDNYDDLLAAEQKIEELEQEAADREAAAEVDALIDAIDDPVTLESEEEIVAARQAYENLTDDQKGFVEKLADLQAAEADLAAAKDDKAVADVQDLIDALPEADDVTPADAEQIAAARAAYEALADDLKDRVDDDKLVADEKALEDYAANQVIAAIAALPEVDDADLEDKDAVDAVKEAYDDLSDADKAKVTNDDKLNALIEKIAQLEKEAADRAAAKAVEDMIDAIEEPITIDSEADIVAARQAYEALTDDQKALVTNEDELLGKEEDLAKIKADIAAAKAVDDMIDAIGDVTLDKEDEITAAREAYEDLTDTQKDLVTKLNDLVAKEAALAQAKEDAKAAKDVDDMIDAIEEPITLGSEAEIVAAREAYEALTDTQKELVLKEAELAEKEAALDALKKEAADRAAAADVDALIDAIDDPVTLESEEEILAARQAYDALTDDQKGYVEDLADLQDAEATLEALKKEAADKAAAAQVDALIDAIDDPVTLESEEEIVAARQAYDDLTEDQKGYVEGLADLQAAEAALDAAKDDKAVADAQALIDALPEADDVTPADAEQIAAARAAYDALDDDLKGRVDDDKLVADEKALEDYAAKQVEEAIAALPEVDDADLEDKDAVDAVKEAYDDLSDADKAKVTNADKLAELVEKLDALEKEANDQAAAKAVDDAIEAIGDVTLDKEDEITAARAAYNALTDDQKALVENLETLKTAEAALAELKAQQGQQGGASSDTDTDKDETSSDNYDTGDSSAVAVAGGLCALMAVAFVATKKKFHD